MTSALTNQQWVFKACLTQTERLFWWRHKQDWPSGLYHSMFALFLGATATTTALACNFTVLLKIWLLRAVSIPPMFLNWSKNPVSLGLKENQFIANGQTPCKFSSVATTKSCCHRCICVIFLFTFLCRHIAMTGNLNFVQKLINPCLLNRQR